jgi:hypothetical protein
MESEANKIELESELQLYGAMLEVLDSPLAKDTYSHSDGVQRATGQVCALPLDGVEAAVMVRREIIPGAQIDNLYITVKSGPDNGYIEIEFTGFRWGEKQPFVEQLASYVSESSAFTGLNMVTGKEARKARMEIAKLRLDRAISEAAQSESIDRLNVEDSFKKSLVAKAIGWIVSRASGQKAA